MRAAALVPVSAGLVAGCGGGGAHHEGAVETAQTAQAQGSAVKQLAGAVVASRTAEITEMKALLDKLS
ncbi:DUF305 domain-containing protein [Dactylosporangium sp. NPDC005555]|uniref:DUF305 domain-containing protein n=1 Tax=Dactylosporangium sp. NPDC005555 TaxID=3154889 RepID=UPI0033AF4324